MNECPWCLSWYDPNGECACPSAEQVVADLRSAVSHARNATQEGLNP